MVPAIHSVASSFSLLDFTLVFAGLLTSASVSILGNGAGARWLCGLVFREGFPPTSMKRDCGNRSRRKFISGQCGRVVERIPALRQGPIACVASR